MIALFGTYALIPFLQHQHHHHIDPAFVRMA